MQKSSGSLQVCAGGFIVCKPKQAYVTMSHTLVSNHVAKKKKKKRFAMKKNTNIKI